MVIPGCALRLGPDSSHPFLLNDRQRILVSSCEQSLETHFDTAFASPDGLAKDGFRSCIFKNGFGMTIRTQGEP
jgi:hypothetical protein